MRRGDWFAPPIPSKHRVSVMPQVPNGSSLLASSDAFYRVLPRYINGGGLVRRDQAYALLHPDLPIFLNAPRVVRQFAQWKRRAGAAPVHPPRTVDIEAYAGQDPYVIQMMEYVHTHLKEDLVGAYVHGSLGTYEAIPYSDFDALVILKDEVFASPWRLARTARKLNRARSIMLQFDPLQHHGWFVLTAAQLNAYPEEYFPLPLFEYAKALLPDQGQTLTVQPRATPAHQQDGLKSLSTSIIDRVERKRFPMNLYELKFVLSQFMLLPALYVQSRDGEGVYKKHSFDRARADFSEDDWRVMDEVSTIRVKWAPTLTRAQRWLLTRRSRSFRRLTRRFAPAIPGSIQAVLTDDFYRRMQKLALLMRQKMEQAQPLPQ